MQVYLCTVMPVSCTHALRLPCLCHQQCAVWHFSAVILYKVMAKCVALSAAVCLLLLPAAYAVCGFAQLDLVTG